jgi:hypothetical protein
MEGRLLVVTSKFFVSDNYEALGFIPRGFTAALPVPVILHPTASFAVKPQQSNVTVSLEEGHVQGNGII